LTIKQGEFVCVIGDVGSGKSSLLHSIVGDLLACDEDFYDTYQEYPMSEWFKESLREHSQK